MHGEGEKVKRKWEEGTRRLGTFFRVVRAAHDAFCFVYTRLYNTCNTPS